MNAQHSLICAIYGPALDPVDTARAVIFKHCDNVAYLHFWITQELALPIKATALCSIHHKNLFDQAFPGHAMGNKAVLIEFESDEGFGFMKSHMVGMKTAVALVEKKANNY